jgi:hypothetical protein
MYLVQHRMGQHGSCACACVAVSLSLGWPDGRFREMRGLVVTLYKHLLVNDPQLRDFLDLLVPNTRGENKVRGCKFEIRSNANALLTEARLYLGSL